MVGVLVDVLLERLATLALDKIERELRLVVGVKQEMENLTLKLEAIRAVLEDAEKRQEMEASVKLWLNQLNDVSYEMDDVLDEWITRVLKHHLEKQDKQAADTLVTTKKKVCFPFPTSCFRFGQVDYQLFLRHEIAKKIEELNQRLASIDERKQSFNFQNTIRAVPELPQGRKTTSLPNVKTFGRDTEKNLIISKLLSESREGNEVPLIIPIVGMGGMGKTSLANLVYNDEKIKSHFDKSIWVCVSDPFEEIKIAKAILEGLGKENTSNEFEHLMKKINESIEGKKFLLVLDDVWNPNSHQWEELVKPLRNGARGSRVLVTTRKEEVVTLMKATTQMISLKELGQAFCLSLFYYSAGINEGSLSKEFEDIGLEIVKRCKGLPLAAKTLGSLMSTKKNIQEWVSVLNSKTWELREIEQDVFQPLLLSYHDLNPAVKRCLLYCVLFPKDYIYNKTQLIELWMSQDYLNTNESKEKELRGQIYFDELVRRSFFQDVEVDFDSNIRCKIHDIVHDFLQYLSKNDCLIIQDTTDLGVGERKVVPNDKVHHVNLVKDLKAGESDDLRSIVRNYKKLRTLIATPSSKTVIGPILFELIAEMKCLRTLSLCHPYTDLLVSGFNKIPESGIDKIPETIGGLIHLRYLDLSCFRDLEELPRAVLNFYNLQTLRLVGCESLGKVDVGMLINLRHLFVEECWELELIKGIEKLTHLRTLDQFNVFGSGEKRNKLEDLKDLNQLQGSVTLSIDNNYNNLEEEEDNATAGGIMLNKAHLQQLKLEFDPDGYGGAQAKMMSVLEPHQALESLTISKYNGDAFSNWLLTLHNLRHLQLCQCKKCVILPALGKLASLESLDIFHLDGVSKVGDEFLGIIMEAGELAAQSTSSSHFISFPKLKKLHMGGMGSWVEWEGLVEDQNSDNLTVMLMPCLSQLTINNCNCLKALPDFLWNAPLQELKIYDSSILQQLYEKEKGEEWAKISHIPTIRIQGRYSQLKS